MIVVGGLAYWPTPKVACSSVKYALALLDGKGAPPTHLAGQVHLKYPTEFFRWDDGLKNHFKFCVVRDPIERFISAYKNRVVTHHDLNVPLTRFARELRLWRSRNRMIRHHTDLQSAHIGPDLSRFDMVCPIERLDELSAVLSKRTGRKVQIRKIGASGPVKVPPLQPDDLRAVVTFYASDYQLLRDYYRSPI